MDPQQRSRLLATQLTALVRDRCGEGGVAPGVFPGGAALVRGDTAWVLLDDAPQRGLGPALAWALQQGAGALDLVAATETETLARRASQFAPAPTVWRLEGRQLVLAAAGPLPPAPSLDRRLVPFVELITAAGAWPIVEHGELTGEVAGLEVCRGTIDTDTGVARLEVGVGRHDREAFALLHGDVPPLTALADVVRKVAPHRRVDADPHPLNRLVPERLLRVRLIDQPGLVGARQLRPAAPPVRREGVKPMTPAVCVGEDLDGRSMVVVTSVGIDLDLVPFAADARLAHGNGDARLVLAVPRRDDHPVTRRLAARLAQPAEVIGLD